MAQTPKYSVIKKQNEIEIRQYLAYIQAEVVIDEKNYKSAIEKGFGVLAGYIFGNNISKQKIEMTSPVQASRSEKIEMTTPVTVSGESSFTVAFIMPSAYTLETLPQPIDSRVHIKLIPERSLAAIRFSGFFRQDAIQKNKQRLSKWLQDQGIEAEGDFIVAGYNPPWVPGFLARNEVLIQVKTDLQEKNDESSQTLPCITGSFLRN
jgi:effector-binding domain-containing protein